MSSALVGSSSTMKEGSSTAARAMATALALAAGEFMRVAVAARRVEPDILERRDHLVVALGGGQLRLVHPQALADDIGNGHARAERAERVLEHDLHLAALRAHLLEAERVHRLAHEDDRPVAGDQPDQRKAERGLAGAALADHAERLALADGDRDAVHRLDMADRLAQHAALDREPDLEVGGLHHHRLVRVRQRRIALGLGRDQFARIGVLRRAEHLRDRAGLDDLAIVHRRRPGRRSCGRCRGRG